MTSNSLILALLALALIYLVYLIYCYISQTKCQNLKLVQFYLDRKFITKLISIMLNEKESHQMILHDVKEYFQLKDVIIYPLKDKQQNQDVTELEVLNYLDKNITSIKKGLFGKEFIVKEISDEIEIYLAQLNNTQSIAVFIKSKHNGLNKYEVDMLISAATPIIAMSLLRQTK